MLITNGEFKKTTSHIFFQYFRNILGEQIFFSPSKKLTFFTFLSGWREFSKDGKTYYENRAAFFFYFKFELTLASYLFQLRVKKVKIVKLIVLGKAYMLCTYYTFLVFYNTFFKYYKIAG
eukprot:TRINITY_DN55422_c0_g1_i3.p3 TRINITY_DN55422_c0_g1~~TRINITY_DN55422_c0_g1_i3.p3  ORF type:complete len:120 (+),score=4.31 TRINITY_DN55422_c0_g1_i3:259-618(+)